MVASIPMPITLTSRVKRLQIFHLPQGKGSVRMTVPRTQHQPNGEMALKEHRVVVPATVTLLAEGRLENQPDELEHTDEVQAALAQRAISITPYEEAPVEPRPVARQSQDDHGSEGGQKRKPRAG